MNYIENKIYGLPKPLKVSRNTRIGTPKHYVHKVVIGNGYVYFKCHIKRQNTSKIKYFKTRKEAILFVELLRLNRYI